MGRLRASTATSPLDAQVQGKVAVAQQALQDALRLCKRARVGRSIEARRALAVERDLARAMSALSNVRRLTPIYDVTDPDLMSEDERAKQWREEQAAREAAAAEAAAEAEARAVEEGGE